MQILLCGRQKAIGLNDRFFKHWLSSGRVGRQGQSVSPSSQADNIIQILYSQHEWLGVALMVIISTRTQL